MYITSVIASLIGTLIISFMLIVQIKKERNFLYSKELKYNKILHISHVILIFIPIILNFGVKRG